MKIIICGAGEVGFSLAKYLSSENMQVTVIDEDTEKEEIKINEKRNQYLTGSSIAGLCSGILGIGGGAILVTINRSILKMDAKMAAGTSYLIAATIVPVALLSHLIMSRNLGIIFNDAGIFAIIIVPLLVLTSAFLGAKYAIKYLPKQVVTNVFILVVSISLLKYISDLFSLIWNRENQELPQGG